MEEIKQLSGDVLVHGEQYFSRIVDAECIKRKFAEDELSLGITANDFTIRRKNGNIADAIKLTFCDECGEDKVRYIDMIISDVCGTFLSDWY